MPHPSSQIVLVIGLGALLLGAPNTSLVAAHSASAAPEFAECIITTVLLRKFHIDVFKGFTGGLGIDKPDRDGEPHVEDSEDDVHLIADVLQSGGGDHDDLGKEY